MKEWEVTLPIAGYAYLTVQADNEDEAISEAMNIVQLRDVEEWESYRQIVRGNVFCGPLNQASARVVDDD